MGIITHNLGLCFNDESYDEFIQLYGRRAKMCSATHNCAMCERTEEDCRACVQVDGKSYMDRASHKLAKQVAKQTGAGHILNPLVFRRDDLCTMGCGGVHVRSKFPSLGCPQMIRQLARTMYNDWIKLFIGAAHNGINKQKPIITHSFFSKVKYDQT